MKNQPASAALVRRVFYEKKQRGHGAQANGRGLTLRNIQAIYFEGLKRRLEDFYPKKSKSKEYGARNAAFAIFLHKKHRLGHIYAN